MSSRDRADQRSKAPALEPRNSKGAAMLELLDAIAYAYFPLRAVGDRIVALAGQTTAEWGLLRSLRSEGEQTVAALARSRPVARQWIQRLANKLARQRLIEFVDNPNHLRAKLMRITPAGIRLLDRIAGEVAPWSSRLESEFDRRDIQATTELLTRLRERLRQQMHLARSRRSSGQRRRS